MLSLPLGLCRLLHPHRVGHRPRVLLLGESVDAINGSGHRGLVHSRGSGLDVHVLGEHVGEIVGLIGVVAVAVVVVVGLGGEAGDVEGRAGGSGVGEVVGGPGGGADASCAKTGEEGGAGVGCWSGGHWEGVEDDLN